QAESDQTENAERQKELPQDAPALGRNGLDRGFGRRFGRQFGRGFGHRSVRRSVQRFRSPAADSGVRMWLPERRVASHPESSSFIFRSASKFLIWPKTSGNGVA